MDAWAPGGGLAPSDANDFKTEVRRQIDYEEDTDYRLTGLIFDDVRMCASACMLLASEALKIMMAAIGLLIGI